MKVARYDSLAALPPSVVARARFPSQPAFFLSLDWFACLQTHSSDPHSTVCIYVAEENDVPVGLLPCRIGPDRTRLTSLTNFYSWVFNPILFDTAVMTDVLDAFGVAIARDRWRMVRLDYLRDDLPQTSALVDALRRHGFDVETQVRYDNWHLQVMGRDFKTYFSARGSQLRNTVKRKGKKLEQSHNSRIEIHIEDGPPLQRAIADYVTVYNKSWKQPEPFPDFSPALISTCARLGILRLGVLYVNDQPAAAQLWIVTSTAYIYKLAYDDAYSDLSVGSLLSAELFRRAIDEDKVTEIDYGVGSENYKKDWMEEKRSFLSADAVNTRLLSGRLYLVLRAMFRRFRRFRDSLRRPGSSRAEQAL